MSRIERTTTTVDHKTGELVSTQKIFSLKKKEVKRFFIIYSEGLLNLYKIERAIDYKVLFFLADHLEYGSTSVKFSPKNKKDFLELLGISSQSFTNSIRRLRDLGLILGSRDSFEATKDTIYRGGLR